jgi:hypothetical protein
MVIKAYIAIFISRTVLRNTGDKGTGIAYDFLLEGKFTTSYHSLKAAVSSILCPRNLTFAERDNKVFVFVTP